MAAAAVQNIAHQTGDCPPSRMDDHRRAGTSTIARLRQFNERRVDGHDLSLQGLFPASPRVTRLSRDVSPVTKVRI